MNLLVISDLHIGKKEQINDFGWKNSEFIDFLDNFINYMQIDKVILNGDIYDLLQNSLIEVYNENSDIIKYFRNEKFVYLKGNHDFYMNEGIFEYNITNSEGQTIHIEHGHNADFFDGTSFGLKLCQLGFDIVKFLIKFNYTKKLFHKVIEKKKESINKIPRKYNTYKYLQYALKLLKKYDVVILGHTHKLESFKTHFLNHKKRYINSGTCSLGRFQAAGIDTETLKFDTVKISKEDVESKNQKFKKIMLSA